MPHHSFSLALLLLWSPSALACMHAAGKNTKPVVQAGQEAIIFHAAGVQDLLIKAAPADAGDGALAWVLPVPSVPTLYKAVGAAAFDQLHRQVALMRQGPQPRSRSAAKSAGSAIRLLPAAQAGPFVIQPIQGAGPKASVALNEWMSSNGFAQIPAAGLDYYVRRGWTFLAVKLSPNRGKATLPALHLRFESERAVYPLKLSTHGGVFAARIYLFTEAVLAEEAFAGARARGFEVLSGGRHLATAAFTRGRLKAKLTSLDAKSAPAALAPLMKARFGDKAAQLSVLLNERVNETSIEGFAKSRWAHVRFAPAVWAEDLSVPGLPDGEVLKAAP